MPVRSTRRNYSSTFKTRLQSVFTTKPNASKGVGSPPPPSQDDNTGDVITQSSQLPSGSSTMGVIAAQRRDVFRNPHATATESTKSSVAAPLVKTCLAALGGILRDMNLPGASACQLVIKAVDKYEETQSNIDALNSLKRQCDHISGVIANALKGKKGPELSEQLKAALEHLGSRLEVVVAPCEEDQKRHFLIKFLNSNEYATGIRETLEEVGRLLVVFVAEVTLAGHLTLTRMIENRALANNIKSLPHVGAAYDSNNAINRKRTMCLPGTRIDILKEIGRWAVTSNERPIYLLTGHAGFGKSTVARTVAERTDAFHILGASFFFSRDAAQLKSNSLFFSTVAYQLSVFDEAFAAAIGRAQQSLKALDAVEKSPAAQLEKLIIEPLESFNTISHTILIVVDALDECEDFESSEGENWRRDIWDGLVTLVERLTFIRIFFTSRPHQHLSTLIANNPLLYVNNTSVQVSDPDISRYLKYKLIEAPDPASRKWTASESEISSLERMTSGLFIVAATAVRFILDPRRAIPPSERIQDLMIQGTIAGPTSSNKLEAVDNMYSTVLHLSLSLCDPGELLLFQTVVGTIIFLRKQFPITHLAVFLGLDAAMLRNIFDKLQAIITLTDDTPQFHKSFVDYVTDPTRSGDLSIPRSRGNAIIVFHCFRTLGDSSCAVDDLVHSNITHAIIYLPFYCSAADPSIVKTLNARADLSTNFWMEVAMSLALAVYTGEAISTIVGCMETEEGNQKPLDVLNIDLRSKEILSEETLRLMLTSRTVNLRHAHDGHLWAALQYAKTLLYHLSNHAMWEDHWITPSTDFWLRYSNAQGDRRDKLSKAQVVDSFLGKRGDDWWVSVFGLAYRTFQPTDEAWSILREKFIELS
ncbi:hypothetical protein PC9H_008442 [Pleurotus ostreatus]|uniref:Nephrocystin 3-like N-terminal domain-containing protein n=1 Tax=Pleurotus ostreatus TaxID=5322 RepID=A0A8H7DT38_PLEOS|nr:uncharacterized protein PC9H_008442 [Pleurotus ostreatus]KAF7426076.1 hypothetical protein PC9H_008442 [Pleurotus ostreatus]